MTVTNTILFTLVAIISLSAVFPKFNIGLLGITATFLIGIFASDLSAAPLIDLFPTKLFFIIFGLALFFGMLAENGTVERATARLLAVIGGRTILIPLGVFALVSFLTTMGVSNIAVTALVAPIAMRLSQKIQLPPFLMAILIVGAASGASFSPLSLSGAIVREYVNRNLGSSTQQMDFDPWQLYFLSFVTQGGVAFAGFHMLGGTAWIRKTAQHHVQIEDSDLKSRFERKHIVSIFIFLIFIVAVTVPHIAFFKGLFSKNLLSLTENIAVPALIGATALMLLRVTDTAQAVKSIPWNTILLIVGMSLFLEFADNAQALSQLSQRLVGLSTPRSVFFLFPFASGLLSAFSSSAGVVLPLFLPMVGAFADHLPGVRAMDLITALSISSHMVDASPLSTLGALCISAIGAEESREKLFRDLLIWSMALIPVGATLCWIIF